LTVATVGYIIIITMKTTTAPRFLGSRTLDIGARPAVEYLVRIGQHEARALVVAGSTPESWKVSKAGSYSGRELDLSAIRQIPRVGPALGKACARLVTA
jgi:hypothetical protein